MSFGRFTQQMVLALPAGIDRNTLVDTLTAVIDHHDMLRAGLRQVDGKWELHALPPGAVDVNGLLIRVDVPAGTDRLDAIADTAMDSVLASLDPQAYRMIGFAWLAREDGPDGLVVAANHAVIDGVSWRILLSDLVAAWAQSGQRVVLPPVGTSFRRWAHGLTGVAAGTREELDHWQQTLSVPDPLLGDRPLGPLDTASTVRTISVEVPTDITQAVLTGLPTMYRAGAEDGLLAALAMAVRTWRARRGVDAPATRVRLEGHGREQSAVDGADLTRTVGWFTSMYPVALDLSAVDNDAAWHGGDATAAAVKAIKEQLRAVPHKGIGFGMLRHLDPESAADLEGPSGRSASTTWDVFPRAMSPQPTTAGYPPPTGASPSQNKTPSCPRPPSSTSTPSPPVPTPACNCARRSLTPPRSSMRRRCENWPTAGQRPCRSSPNTCAIRQRVACPPLTCRWSRSPRRNSIPGIANVRV